MLLAIILVLAIAGGMGWLVKSGLQKGTTFFPSKQVSQQRPVSRQQEPATFWLAIGLGAGGLGLWGTREVCRRNPPTRQLIFANLWARHGAASRPWSYW